MRKVIFLSLFTFLLLSARAQVQTQVTGDSVFIHSNTGTGELILQNSTDTVNGFLFNKGGGRTAFVRGLIKIDDSTYLVGADTLHIRNFGGLLFPGPQYSIIRSNGDGTAVADYNMGFYPGSTYGELYFQNSTANSYSDIYVDDRPGSSLDIESLSGWGIGYYSGSDGVDSRTTLTLYPDSANTSGIQLQDYNSGNTVGIYPSTVIPSLRVVSINADVSISSPSNMYNLILPPTAGADGQVLGRVTQTGRDVILDWMNGGSGTLQNAFDAAPTANPQINAHGNSFVIDSIQLFYVKSFIDSLADGGISSKGGGYNLFYENDSAYTGVAAFRGNANLTSSLNNYSQQLAVTPISTTFSGTNVLGNPESKVIFQNTDTLLSAPPYIAVFDADTLKKYPFVSAIGGMLIPGSQGNIVRSNGDGTAIADYNMSYFYSTPDFGRLYWQTPSSNSYFDIGLYDQSPNSYLDIETLSGWGFRYSTGADGVYGNKTTLSLDPDSSKTSGIQFQDYNTGNTVGIYPSTTAGVNYNLVLPSDSGTVGKVLSKVSQSGNDVSLGWVAGGGGSGTLQNAFDAAPTASPQINGHGNSFSIDSITGFRVTTYPDSNSYAGIFSKGNNYTMYYGDDSTYTTIAPRQGSANLSSYNNNYSQQLAVTPTFSTFSGTNISGNPESKVIFQNTDTLLSAPPYIAVFDADTLKKYPYNGGNQGIQSVLNVSSDISTQNNNLYIGSPSKDTTSAYFEITDQGDGIAGLGGVPQFFVQTGSEYSLGDRNREFGLGWMDITASGIVIDNHNTSLSFGSLDSNTSIQSAALGIGVDGNVHKYAIGNSSGGSQNLQNVTSVGNTTSNSIQEIDSASNVLVNITQTHDYGRIIVNDPTTGGIPIEIAEGQITANNFVAYSTFGIQNPINSSGTLIGSPYVLDTSVFLKTPTSSGTFALSVNGNYADSTGNIIFPGGGISSIATGYGLSGGPITTTGTIAVDSAALHAKFLALSDSTIFYPFSSNPKNYLTAANAWSTTGNAGTTGGTNFIGTTDNVPINFRVNNGLVGTIGTTSTYNVSLGVLSLPNTSTGIKNMAIGGAALTNNTTGTGNNAVGYTTLYHNTTGNYNTANGWASLGYNQTGSGNTAMGAGSMNTTNGAQTTSNYNTALGFDALIDLFTGNYNIGLGAYGGYQKTGKSNTLFVSDSVTHLYMKIDSTTGAAPNMIGKDGTGFWHTYEAPTYGTATLVAGTVTVSTALVKTGAKIFVSVNTPGGTQGFLSAPAGNIVNGTSFKINSTSATETSTVNWQIIN